jgi:hypothetical protein
MWTLSHAPPQVGNLRGSDDIARIDRVVITTCPTAEDVATVARHIFCRGKAVASALADVKVQTASTDQEVDAATPVESILAAPPKDGIVASTAEDDVRPLPGEDQIVASEPADDVGLDRASQLVIVSGCANHGALRTFVACGCRDRVVA